jgi:hypothetical protein
VSRPAGIYERPAVPVESACIQCGRAYMRHPKASRAHWCHGCAKARLSERNRRYLRAYRERVA